MSLKLRAITMDAYGIYDDKDALYLQGEVVHDEIDGWVLDTIDNDHVFKPEELIEIADLLFTLNRILPSG